MFLSLSAGNESNVGLNQINYSFVIALWFHIDNNNDVPWTFFAIEQKYHPYRSTSLQDWDLSKVYLNVTLSWIFTPVWPFSCGMDHFFGIWSQRFYHTAFSQRPELTLGNIWMPHNHSSQKYDAVFLNTAFALLVSNSPTCSLPWTAFNITNTYLNFAITSVFTFYLKCIFF